MDTVPLPDPPEQSPSGGEPNRRALARNWEPPLTFARITIPVPVKHPSGLMLNLIGRAFDAADEDVHDTFESYENGPFSTQEWRSIHVGGVTMRHSFGTDSVGARLDAWSFVRTVTEGDMYMGGIDLRDRGPNVTRIEMFWPADLDTFMQALLAEILNDYPEAAPWGDGHAGGATAAERGQALASSAGLKAETLDASQLSPSREARVPKVGTQARVRWHATWLKVRGQWRQGESCKQIEEWLRKTNPSLACSADTVRDITRAGDAGLLDE